MAPEEIMFRRLAGQHLITPSDCQTVIRDLCGIQAQFLSNAMHALKIRCHDFSEDRPELCTAGLVKSWTLRGTVHVFSQTDLPLFLHQGRKHFLRPCDTLEADESITKERKQYFADLILEQIAAGIHTREELKTVCAEHGMTGQEAESVFNSWGGTIRALCEMGTICHKVQEKKAFELCPPFTPMEEAPARLEMARRYFTHFAPATIRDAAYFFGTTQTEVKQWLSQLPVSTTTCRSKTYYYIEPDASGAAQETTSPTDIPACIFLAGFDQLMLGYQKTENPFLPPEHLRGIFNLSGIVMPAVLLHGRVAGKWKKNGKKLSVTLFETISPKEKEQAEICAFELWPTCNSIEFI